MYVHTQNSIYEVDQDKKLIRKLSGIAAPTARTGALGEWKAYEDLYLNVGDTLGIIWRYDVVDGKTISRTTMTSVVLSIKDSNALAS